MFICLLPISKLLPSLLVWNYSHKETKLKDGHDDSANVFGAKSMEHQGLGSLTNAI